MPLDIRTENPLFSCNIVSLSTNDNASLDRSFKSYGSESWGNQSSCITSMDIGNWNTFHHSVDIILNCLLCQELRLTVETILKEETETLSTYSSRTETYVYIKDHKNKEYNNKRQRSPCYKSLDESVTLDNSYVSEDNFCQVEVIDEKQAINRLYGVIMIKTSPSDLCQKNGNDKTICGLNFLLKTDKIMDELTNLLHNHIQNKTMPSVSNKKLVKDRRLISIEQNTKCHFIFPNNLKVFRYKGTNCIRMRITSFNDRTNLRALNLFKMRIPKLYNECIFTEQILKSSDSNMEYSPLHHFVRRRPSSLERPVTEYCYRTFKKSISNYSAPLNLINSWN